MARDRQIFEEITLPNGIRVFYYPEDIPYVDMRIVVPVGTVHNCGNVLPGTAHFLEHILAERSQRYPEVREFNKFVMMNGGKCNAITYRFMTQYYLQIAADKAQEAWNGLFSEVFKPFILDEDIEMQRKIIANERKRRRWYPGEDEISHYYFTQCQRNETITLNQLFGSDADLATTTKEQLQAFHAYYFNDQAFVFVGGNIDISMITRSLEQLKTSHHVLPEQYAMKTWVRREYHERTFKDASRHQYTAAWILNPLPQREIEIAIGFIGKYMMNTAHGVIHEWIRNKLGVYETKWGTVSTRKELSWMMEFPLNSLNQVATVRNELYGRMLEALQDIDRIAREAERRKKETVFYLQTVQKIIDAAIVDIDERGRIISERESMETFDACKDQEFIMEVFERYFAPEEMGEFCEVPES